MSTVRLKKGFDIKLLGAIEGTDVAFTSPSRSVAVVPDDFHGIIPRMDESVDSALPIKLLCMNF